jgi:hypothetical protein
MKWLIVRMGFILGGEIAAGRAVLADGAALHRALFASYRRQLPGQHTNHCVHNIDHQKMLNLTEC